jgi:hypothetical protein
MMTDADTMSRQGSPDDDAALRKRLLARVGIAGLLIAELLGGLVLFDSFYTTEEEKPSVRVASVKLRALGMEPGLVVAARK